MYIVYIIKEPIEGGWLCVSSLCKEQIYIPISYVYYLYHTHTWGVSPPSLTSSIICIYLCIYTYIIYNIYIYIYTYL